MCLTSGFTGEGIGNLLGHISHYGGNRENNKIPVYIVGATNVGKSTLLNQIIKQARKREYSHNQRE